MDFRNAAAGLAILAICAAAPSEALAQAGRSSARDGGGRRLFLRFVEDAAVVPTFWLEGQARFQTNTPAFSHSVRNAGEASSLTIGPVIAFNVAEDLEFGGRIGAVYRDPDPGGNDTGLNDLDIWGKISVVSDPLQLTLGVLVQLPTGDEDEFLGTGETNVEFFGSARRNFDHMSLVGHIGVRINQDADLGPLQLEGDNSFLAGAAFQFPAGERLLFTVEWAVETNRFEGRNNSSQLLGGFQYEVVDSVLVRGALAGALSSDTPDADFIGSVVWLF